MLILAELHIRIVTKSAQALESETSEGYLLCNCFHFV